MAGFSCGEAGFSCGEAGMVPAARLNIINNIIMRHRCELAAVCKCIGLHRLPCGLAAEHAVSC